MTGALLIVFFRHFQFQNFRQKKQKKNLEKNGESTENVFLTKSILLIGHNSQNND